VTARKKLHRPDFLNRIFLPIFRHYAFSTFPPVFIDFSFASGMCRKRDDGRRNNFCHYRDSQIAFTSRCQIRHSHKDFRYINISGESLSRDMYLKNNASLGSDSSHWISQDIDSIVVRVINNSAVISFRVLDKFVYEGSPYENYCRSTFVYERQGDVWKCVIGHTTKIE
jgi:hypothetical protein